jgi:spore maturation protein CgeB
MRILLVSMLNNFGDESLGRSYEYYNFYLTLKKMGHEVELFDFMYQANIHGVAGMNKKLLERTAESNPMLTIFVLYTDQIYPQTVRAIRDISQTLGIFYDDTWRKKYSQFWANEFDFFTSPDIECREKYKKLGLNNSIYMPFGVNEEIYYPSEVAKTIDVSFVGGWHPYREWLINTVRKAGIEVEVAGYGWGGGMLTHEEMIGLFNKTKVNLNLSNSSSWDIRYLFASPMALPRQIRSGKNCEQLKARHFEICACSAFQLSYYVDGLDKCYSLGEEIGIYLDSNDLVEKIKFYLDNEGLRNKICESGYSRTIKSHTYSARFKSIFQRLGLD